MKKSLRRVVGMPHPPGAFGRQCRTDDDKVRLLSVVSRRSSLSDEAPLLPLDNSSSSSSSTSSCDYDAFGNTTNQEINVHHNGVSFDADNTPAQVGQLIDLSEPTTNRVVKTAQRVEGGKRHEWVFTLYDFDGKGTPNKEDILSIVRAIYDVLGSAKIQARSAEDGMNGGKGARPTVGAFKIRLSLTADENADVAVSAVRRNVDCFPRRARRRDQGSSSVDSAVCGKIKGHDATAVTSICQQSGDPAQEDIQQNLRYHKKPTKRRGGCTGAGVGTERYSSPPLHSRKMSRRSASTSQNTTDSPATGHHGHAESACVSCTFRDYVNLSELENCCCSNGDQHGQQKHPRGVVHHIRHCDRHCHCAAPDRTPRSAGCYRLDGKSGALCFLHASPPTAQVRRCADFVSSRCCRVIDPAATYGAAPSSTSLHVNVQARAYYQDRTTTAHGKAAQRRHSTNLDKETDPANVSPTAPTIQQGKQKSKEGKRMQSRERVKSWIMNDPVSPMGNQENVETRGVADGSDRLLVEHKHVHKHNHYHHHFY